MEAQLEGKVRSIGVSNYGIHHLDELDEYIHSTGSSQIDVGQYEIHPWCDRRNIIEWLKKRNVVVQAYSPLAHGSRFDEPILNALGKKYNKSPAQIMIRWVLQNVSIHLSLYSTRCMGSVSDEYRVSSLYPNQRLLRESRKTLKSLTSSCLTMRLRSFIRASIALRTGTPRLITIRASTVVCRRMSITSISQIINFVRSQYWFYRTP